MGYDLNHPSGDYVLTHARAFQMHPQFELIGGVDFDMERRHLFESNYGCSAYANLNEAIKATNPNVVVVSNPTEEHIDTLFNILNFDSPKVVLCEKPVSFDLKKAKEIISAFKAKKRSLYVNYMRCSDVGVAELYQRIRTGKILGPMKGVVWYTNGLLNNASHYLNLLQYLFGEIKDSTVLSAGRALNEFDVELDFQVSFQQGKFNFFALPSEKFSHNALEIIAANGRLRYESGGEHIIWEGIDSNKMFPERVTLSSNNEYISSDFHRIQWHVADKLSACINGNSEQICSGEDAVKTLEVLTNLIRDNDKDE